MVMIALIPIILAFSNWMLSKWIVGPIRVELHGEGKRIDRWGKVILASISITVFIALEITLFRDVLNNNALKLFWMVLVIAAVGFQSLIDWKYLKDSKQYIVSLIVLVEGVALVYFLF